LKLVSTFVQGWMVKLVKTLRRHQLVEYSVANNTLYQLYNTIRAYTSFGTPTLTPPSKQKTSVYCNHGHCILVVFPSWRQMIGEAPE